MSFNSNNNKLFELLKTLKIKSSKYIKLSNNKIIVDGYDMTSKLFNANTNKKTKLKNYDLKKIKGLIDKLGVIRINHLGMGYSVDNLENEIKNIKNRVKSNIYIDMDCNTYKKNREKWLFAGNPNSKNISRLFEIIIIKNNHKLNVWNPHFQIDFDTNKTEKELNKILKTYSDKQIFRYNILNKDKKLVLTMGQICKIGDINIIFGIGTKYRKNKEYRNTFIKL